MTDFNDMAMVYPIGEDMPTTPRMLLVLDEHEEAPDDGLPGHLDVCRDLCLAFTEVAAGRHATILVSARIPPELRERLLAGRTPGTSAIIVGADLDEETRRQLDDRAQALEAQLTKAEEINTLGEMAASLAHELHQPLGAVVNYLHAARHILDRDVPDLERLREAIERSLRQARRAAEILHGIRAFVYREPPTRAEVCLDELIREVCDLVAGQARLYGVDLVHDLEAERPLIFINPVQLQQVVMNVIGNGIEALRETVEGVRRLIVRTRVEDGLFVVTVSDTGPGFAQGELEQMFEPFFTTRAGGMGMGLAICRRFVEAHGGGLTVRRNEPETGLTFRIALPADTEDLHD